MQRCLAIGGWTQPVSAAEKGSKSIQRDSTRETGLGKGPATRNHMTTMPFWGKLHEFRRVLGRVDPCKMPSPGCNKGRKSKPR
jgi:hypothetical protein